MQSLYSQRFVHTRYHFVAVISAYSMDSAKEDVMGFVNDTYVAYIDACRIRKRTHSLYCTVQ
jgi:hypothetical protein